MQVSGHSDLVRRQTHIPYQPVTIKENKWDEKPYNRKLNLDVSSLLDVIRQHRRGRDGG